MFPLASTVLRLSPLHGFSLLLTLALVIGAGIALSRRQRGAAGFSLGGRQSGAGLVAGAIVGSSVGGGATIGTAQLAYQHGMVAWCFTLGMGLGLVLLALFLSKALRHSGLETVPQYLASCYGRAAEPVVSLISCLGIFFACASSMLPGMSLLSALFGLSPDAAALLSVLLIAAYILVGGQRGASVSGMLKSALLWVGLGVAACGACCGSDLHTAGSFSLLSRGGGYTLSCLGATAVGIMTAQMYIQAIFSARHERAAVQGALLGAALTVPVGLMATLVGMRMRLSHPELAACPLLALPQFLLTELPPWLGGATLGGLVLAIISSAAAQALAIGTMVSRDLAAGLLGVQRDRCLLGINRAALVLAAAAVALFCRVNPDASVLVWNYLSMALRGSGIFLPLLLAVLTRGRIVHHLGGAWVLSTMLLSTAAALAASLCTESPPVGIGLAVSALLLALGAGRKAWHRLRQDKSPITP